MRSGMFDSFERGFRAMMIVAGIGALTMMGLMIALVVAVIRFLGTL